MKALRKQRLCSFLWGWGKWENRPCSIQKRPGISLPDRFSLFQGGTYGAPLQIPGRFILARAVQHIPVTGGIAYVVPLSIYGFHRTAPAVREKDKRDSLRRPPVNLWLSSDRASGLRKRQKGQLASSPCQSMAFTRPRQRSEKKTKGTAYAVPPVNSWLSSDRASGLRKKTKGTASAVPPVNLRFSPDRASGLGKRQKGQLRRPSCQFMAFIGPRQRSEKKTKGTASAVPPVYGVIIKFR